MLERQKLAKQYKRTPLEELVPLKAPLILYIDPCGACNFDCNFCPCYRSDFMKEERHKMMSFDLFRKIVNDMEQFEEKVKVVYLYGFGEPLLNKNLPEMAAYLKKKNVCREIRIYTNGALLSPEMNKKLVDSGIDLIRISVVGLSNKDYKEISNVDMEYTVFVDNIRDLYEKSRGKAEVSVKIANAAIRNEKDAELFFDTFESISDYIFIEDIVEGWPEFEEIILPQDSISADNWIWKKNKKKGFSICTYGLTNMVVYSNGYISACPADWKYGTQYGDVRETSLKKLWHSKKLKDFQLKHLEGKRSEISVCNNCKCCGYDNVDDVADIIVERLRKGY